MFIGEYGSNICASIGHYENLPFPIPRNWAWVRHNDILEISGGAQPAKLHFSSELHPNYIRLYQIRDYGDNPCPVYIPLEMASKRTQRGDILLARYGGSLGKVFRAEDGAYNVAMAKIIFKYDSLLDIDFAYYLYLSKLYQGKLQEVSRTAQAGFNANDFNDLYFPIPPLHEQRRIVEKIRTVYHVIDKITEEL